MGGTKNADIKSGAIHAALYVGNADLRLPSAKLLRKLKKAFDSMLL